MHWRGFFTSGSEETSSTSISKPKPPRRLPSCLRLARVIAPQLCSHQTGLTTGTARYAFGIELELTLWPHDEPDVRAASPTIQFQDRSELYEIYGHIVERLRTGPPTRKLNHGAEQDLERFAQILANNHNFVVRRPPATNVGMYSVISAKPSAVLPQWRYDFWILVQERSIEHPRPEAPWAIEIASPILRPATWRETVNATWTFLQDDYMIGYNRLCGTHVHVSIGHPYTLSELKLVAVAVIHWEPAWEAVLPLLRRGNYQTMSLFVDNRNIAWKGITRQQAIAQIMACGKKSDLLDLLQPNKFKCWGFNFLNVLGRSNTIEFRRGAPCTTRAEVDMWISVATSFILAAVQAGTADAMTSQNCTVVDLKEFMLRARDQFIREDIERLFVRKEDGPTLAPIISVRIDDVSRRNVGRVTAADIGRIHRPRQ